VALERHTRAASCAVTTEDKRNAIWGQFITRGELGLKEAALATIDEFAQTKPSNIEDRLREAQAHITFATRFGGIERALRRWGHFSELIDARCDPLVKTGFLHTLGQALLLSTRYDEAVELTHHQEAEAIRLGLDFVLSHTLCLRIGAEIGRREFDAARAALRRATPIVSKFDDGHSAANLAVLQAELDLVESLPAEAAAVLESEPDEWSNPGMAGEFVGVHALASAAAGDFSAASDFAAQSARYSDQIEALMPRLWALAVAAHYETGDVTPISRSFEEAVRNGHLDSVVLAYRSYRPILEILASNGGYRPRLKRLIHAARDYGLARPFQLGVSAPPAKAKDPLTPREREVLGLVQRGLSNAEIGQALWIEESTAKVHVGHILRKLGVRTRTEAAVLATQADSDDG
jgi:DNA-binding CsgD family transcriptional regulator